MKIWVLGSNSKIGEMISSQSNLLNSQVFLANRKPTKNEFHFDLREPLEIPELSHGDSVVICSGLTNINYCEQNPKAAYEINVQATLDLIKNLHNKNVYFTFISSSSIFEGQKNICNIYSTPSAHSIYAQNKIAVEDFCMQEIKENFSVLRLTKIITPDWELLKYWNMQSQKGNIITPFKNRFFSPVNGIGVAELIIYLLNNKPSGIFQIGGSREITYADFCYEYFKNRENLENFIKPINDSDEFRAKTQILI